MTMTNNEAELRADKPLGGLSRSEYSKVHYAVRKNWGKPTHCEKCGVSEGKRLEWSNKSGLYSLDKDDWQMLCTPCHAVYDRRKEYCIRGHKQSGANIRMHTKGSQVRCRPCGLAHSQEWFARNKDKRRLMNAKRTRKLTQEEEAILHEKR